MIILELASGATMGKKDGGRKNAAGERANKENAENSSPGEVQDQEANASVTASANIAKVLEEIQDFRKDTKQQLNDIKFELTNVTRKIAAAETRIEETEDRVHNVEQVLNKMIKVINQQENKVLDQEGRSRRENLRVYNVPEGAEGLAMVEFVEKLLRDTLEIPQTTSLDIDRAHRALAPRPPGDREDKPRSIIIKFLRFKTKEEILRKAWGKKKVLFIGRLIYLDQDYPPAVLQKRMEYSDVKQVLRQRKIRFQTPFPAKLRVFYEDGVRLYQTAEEATTNMKDRGLPVNVITPKESLAEQLSHFTWETVGGPRQRETGEGQEKSIRERLRAFRRQHLLHPEEL